MIAVGIDIGKAKHAACRVDFKSGIFVESKSGKSCAISGFANLQLCVIVYLC